jgi:hypothetical protein
MCKVEMALIRINSIGAMDVNYCNVSTLHVADCSGLARVVK